MRRPDDARRWHCLLSRLLEDRYLQLPLPLPRVNLPLDLGLRPLVVRPVLVISKSKVNRCTSYLPFLLSFWTMLGYRTSYLSFHLLCFLSRVDFALPSVFGHIEPLASMRARSCSFIAGNATTCTVQNQESGGCVRMRCDRGGGGNKNGCESDTKHGRYD